MDIPARLVKALRERTGCGVLDCRAALVATEGWLPDAEYLLTGRLNGTASGPDVRRALAEHCGLADLRVGVELRFPGLQETETWPAIHALWVAEIQPAFMGAACLAVFATPEQRAGIFLVSTWPAQAEDPAPEINRPGSALFSGGLTLFPDGWQDPVAAELGRLPVWSVPPFVGAWLDGRRYEMDARSREGTFKLSFANPSEPSLLALEQALLRTAEQLAQNEAAVVPKDYVRRWATYAQA